MNTNWTTKLLLSFIVACSATLATFGQEALDIRINPQSDATIIGQIESASLAVNAPWKEGQGPVDGWQPIFFRGTFEVYLNNSDIAKDLTPTPGSKYFLAPGRGTEVLSTATKEDKSEVISVDSRYCRMKVETILIGYIEYSAPAPLVTPEEITVPSEVSKAKDTTSDKNSKEETKTAAFTTAPIEEAPSVMPIADAQAVLPIVEEVEVAAINPARTLYGTLQNISSSKQRKFDSDYQLVDSSGKTISFINTQGLPRYLILSELINQRVIVTGHLSEINDSNTLRLVATAIKQTR